VLNSAEMQDMCARILGMERGRRGSKKEHLDALEYKVKVQEKRAALAEHAQKAAEEKQEAASERAKEIAIKNADAVFKLQNKTMILRPCGWRVERSESPTSGASHQPISLCRPWSYLFGSRPRLHEEDGFLLDKLDLFSL